jgi:surface polysaccharide O-acyltransferase-like enzyme
MNDASALVDTARRGPPEPPTRVLWPDLVRVVAVYAVIVLHVAAVPVTHLSELPAASWMWANAYDSLVRPCIPLFVMVSGALLLTPREWNFRTFVTRRASKVLVPFLAWSALYAFWNQLMNEKAFSLGRLLKHVAGAWPIP